MALNLVRIEYQSPSCYGEHDYYLDLANIGKSYSAAYYSFDHKGVHFIILNSIRTMTTDFKRWPTTKTHAGNGRLDNPNGSPFMVVKNSDNG